MPNLTFNRVPTKVRALMAFPIPGSHSREIEKNSYHEVEYVRENADSVVVVAVNTELDGVREWPLSWFEIVHSRKIG